MGCGSRLFFLIKTFSKLRSMSAKTINDNDGGSVDGGNDAQERILADEVSFTSFTP